MAGRGILDADMATLGRWIADGVRWWIDELAGMVPARWRRQAGEGGARLVLAPDLALPVDAPMFADRGPATIVLPRARSLIRRIERPAVSDRDLPRMLAFEADALLPFPAAEALVAGRIAGAGSDAGRAIIEVAGLPRGDGAIVAERLAAAGVEPGRVVLEEPPGPLPPFDFAPAMRAAGLLPPHRQTARLVWAVVGFLFLLNIGLVIWRDVARVDRLEAIVAAQRPAVDAARRISGRIRADRTTVERTVALRRTRDPIAGMALVAGVLPPGAWLQRYEWSAAGVRLTGYRPRGADVVGALRRSQRFQSVKSASRETQPEVPAGQPFDLVASFGPR